jgi:hypothetical protein
MSAPHIDEDESTKGHRDGGPLPPVAQINLRAGFFHAYLSYRVNTDADLVQKIHDKLHLLAKKKELLDLSPYPEGFRQDESVLGSRVRVFYDAYCLKDGLGWEGDGDAKHGGFIGALLLSPVYVPVLSAYGDTHRSDFDRGSIGALLQLTSNDRQDNVLLELILARELHLISRTSGNSNGEKALAPCSYIIPLFRNQDIWRAYSLLQKTASALNNAKAKSVMNRMGFCDEAISEELRNGTLTVHEVFEFFTRFQGVKLYDHGAERYQVVAAANGIIHVIEQVRSDVDNWERQVSLHAHMTMQRHPRVQQSCSLDLLFTFNLMPVSFLRLLNFKLKLFLKQSVQWYGLHVDCVKYCVTCAPTSGFV